MTLLTKLRSRKRDMKTLSGLISSSIERANLDGGRHAGAHDLLIAALDLEDGTAEAAFARLGTTGQAFVDAVDEQDLAALRSLGIDDRVSLGGEAPSPGSGRFGRTDATYEAAVEHVHEIHNEGREIRPLVGAHVVAGVARVDRGVAARAFAVMGLEPDAVVAAARAVAEETP